MLYSGEYIDRWSSSDRKEDVLFINELLDAMNNFLISKLEKIHTSRHLDSEITVTIQFIKAFGQFLYEQMYLKSDVACRLANVNEGPGVVKPQSMEINIGTPLPVAIIYLLPLFRQAGDKETASTLAPSHRGCTFTIWEIKRKFNQLNLHIDNELLERLSESIASALLPYRKENEEGKFTMNELIQKILRDLKSSKYLNLAEQLGVLFAQYSDVDALDSNSSSLANSGRHRFMSLLYTALRDNKNLHYLDLSWMCFTHVEFSHLCGVISCNTNLFSLVLNNVNSREIISLNNLLRTTTSLGKLEVSRIDFPDKEFEYLCESLSRNKSLSRFTLSKNTLSDICIMPFCKVIMMNKNLLSIDLNGNNISEKFVSCLCRVLRKDTVLLSLNLEKNNLSGKSIVHLSAMLTMNKTLRNLGLKRSNLNQNDILNLCKGLRENNRLNRLDLSCNNFDDKDIPVLCDALTNKHSGLHSLKFSPMTNFGIETLCDMVQTTSLHFIKVSKIILIQFPSGQIEFINSKINCTGMLLTLNRFLARNRERDHRQLRWALVFLSHLTDPRGVNGTFGSLPYDIVKLIVTHCLSSLYDQQYKFNVVKKLSASVNSIISERNARASPPLAHLIQLGIGAAVSIPTDVQQSSEPSGVKANISPNQVK